MTFHHFEVLGSTNDELARMADDGAREWSIVTADRQTAGRGRRERDWWSPAGNLHMSVLLRPAITPRRLMRLPVLASLAFIGSVGGHGAALRVKWPNDILLEGRKMAGILTESRSEGERVLWAVVGFGVNMTRRPGSAPPELEGRRAFVEELDESLTTELLARRIVSGMRQWYGALEEPEWDGAREEWARHALLNEPYIHRDGKRETAGIPVGLDRSGGLVMATDGGKVTVFTGELEKRDQDSDQGIGDPDIGSGP